MLLLVLILTVLVATAATGPPLVTVTAETVWDIPGETDQYLLGGLLVDAGWDLHGNVCFVDYNNRDLKLFSPDGRYLRTLGREGEGPGEVTDARLLLRHEDGRLGLLQKFPARVVWLRPDGSPGGHLDLVNTLGGEHGGGFLSLPHAVQYPGGLLGYLAVMSLTPQGPAEHHWIAPIAADGTVGRPLWHREETQAAPRGDGRIHEADLYYIWAARWAPDGHGRRLARPRTRRLPHRAPGGRRRRAARPRTALPAGRPRRPRPLPGTESNWYASGSAAANSISPTTTPSCTACAGPTRATLGRPLPGRPRPSARHHRPDRRLVR